MFAIKFLFDSQHQSEIDQYCLLRQLFSKQDGETEQSISHEGAASLFQMHCVTTMKAVESQAHFVSNVPKD